MGEWTVPLADWLHCLRRLCMFICTCMSAAPAPAAAAPVVDWSEAHRKFVNHGLAKWRQVRSAWTGREDEAAGAKRAAAAAAAGADAASSSGAAAAAPGGGKTALPHAPLARGRSRSKYADTSDEERAEGTDEDEFVAASSSDDDPNERDINADVPAILEAREHYQPFVPRVKLSHMVDILICIWEDEEE